jgi:hypothetical protein
MGLATWLDGPIWVLLKCIEVLAGNEESCRDVAL